MNRADARRVEKLGNNSAMAVVMATEKNVKCLRQPVLLVDKRQPYRLSQPGTDLYIAEIVSRQNAVITN
jgi:hypothetical protein